MTKTLLVTTALAGTMMAGAAFGADLPRRAAPPLLAPVPIFTWTGAYFGINAGYVSTDRARVLTAGISPVNAANVAIGARPGILSLPTDGVTAGGQIGYNFQFTPGSGVVVGVEADASYTDLSRSVGFVGTGGNPSFLRQDLNFLGTVRGRLGYAFDRVLVYGTGGFAYGDVDNRAAFLTPGGALAFAGRQARIETGYAVGGGIEYALPTDSFLNFFRSSAVTVKAEGLYYDLGRRNVLVGPTAIGLGAGYVSRFENNGYLARVGLNYKFGTF